ncbi:hypothetical protein [Actinacidiphila bryophytorum]|uniref:hypothetical protein n=1 Tax=Actinacidiphila bryophytorum TaxID=1436133 RepID=UPI00217696F9|nr:hypothetical protein [Actinacidiphila bryophytorum]UWE07753.1 hypothetical protein NYE86_02740 [Actinacidiphila bryophytorum]
MFARLLGRGGERPAAQPYALPAPRRGRNGAYKLEALGDERVLALLDAARAADWAAVKQALAPFDLGRDHLVLSELADVAGVQDWIGAAVAQDKEHRAAALLVSGARHIVWGWEARTSDLAKNVSQAQWRTFRERLDIAEEQLLEAAELQPAWVAPWRRLVTSARGMSLPVPVKEARRDAALRRNPLDLETHLEWVSQLQTRWGGEKGEALAFAREALGRAPEGDRLACVIAYAYIEDWFEAKNGDHLHSARVQAELRDAAERSVLHPGYVRRPGWQYDLNLFAMALSLANERTTAGRVFQELDGARTVAPWHYFTEPDKQFARFRGRL